MDYDHHMPVMTKRVKCYLYSVGIWTNEGMKYLELNDGSQEQEQDNVPFFRVYASKGSEAETTFFLDGVISIGRAQNGLRLLGWEEQGGQVKRFFKFGKETTFIRYRDLLNEITKANRNVFTRAISNSIYGYAFDRGSVKKRGVGPQEDFGSPTMAESDCLKNELDEVVQMLGEGTAADYYNLKKVRSLLNDAASCIEDWKLQRTEVFNTVQTRTNQNIEELLGKDTIEEASHPLEVTNLIEAVDSVIQDLRTRIV